MTRKEAIENHRKMWNWIADETVKQRRKILKSEYPFYDTKTLRSNCFLCEYTNGDCNVCPFEWPADTCYGDVEGNIALYILWLDEECLQKRAEYAREIANLPEDELYV